MLDWAYLNNMLSLKIAYNRIKLTFSSENKFYDRKESSLTKYYCIQSSPLIYICKLQQIYLGLIFKNNLYKTFFQPWTKRFLLILVLEMTHRKYFMGFFPCLKVFEINLKACRYNLFLGPGANQKWFKQIPSIARLSCFGKAWRCHFRTWAETLWKSDCKSWQNKRQHYCTVAVLNKLSSAFYNLAICVLLF